MKKILILLEVYIRDFCLALGKNGLITYQKLQAMMKTSK